MYQEIYSVIRCNENCVICIVISLKPLTRFRNDENSVTTASILKRVNGRKRILRDLVPLCKVRKGLGMFDKTIKL